ncbi:MAG TPA: dTDP-glucose 4,6-dehydratase [Candidatus Eisenbacteria bacterium]|nr:dTDP-glucose 4,6-dehydratase [Candidatus Eisenbacteria bacterium]
MKKTSARKRRILVTGGAGFIGSHLVRLWLREDPGVSIVNLDKLTYCGDPARLADVQGDPRYQFMQGDVQNPADVKRAIAGCDGVVHLAAETHVDRSLLEGKVFFESNTIGTYVLLEEARRARVSRFLHVSTDEVYGSRLTGFFKETDAMSPSSPYSVSKTAADLLALSYAHTHGLDVVVTRGANTFGPYQYPEKAIPLFVSNALADQPLPLYGDGLQVRNWIYVEDHCRAILRVFDRGKKGEAYNVSSVNYKTNIEMTRQLLKILGKPFSLVKKVRDRLGHDRRYALNNSKLRALGWKERYSFREALEKTVFWYRDNEAWWRAIKEKNREFSEYYAKAYGDRMK